MLQITMFNFYKTMLIYLPDKHHAKALFTQIPWFIHLGLALIQLYQNLPLPAVDRSGRQAFHCQCNSQ